MKKELAILFGFIGSAFGVIYFLANEMYFNEAIQILDIIKYVIIIFIVIAIGAALSYIIKSPLKMFPSKSRRKR
ncbi:MAG: hypothetical protein PHU34_03140 [Candidatus Methanoperedens sp.]|nr:hypothetical protein [Candidatus Methanoperedens sp.]